MAWCCPTGTRYVSTRSPKVSHSRRLQFYNGEAPAPFTNPDLDSVRHPHREYCSQLESEMRSHINDFLSTNSQTVLSQFGSLENHPQVQALFGPLSHLHVSNCTSKELPYDFHAASASSVDLSNVRPALLQLKLATTPNDAMVNDILATAPRSKKLRAKTRWHPPWIGTLPLTSTTPPSKVSVS